MIDNGTGISVHTPYDAIIATLAQAKSCDNRDCRGFPNVSNGEMAIDEDTRPDAAEVFRRLDALGLKQRDLAEVLNLEPNKVSKVRSGERQFKAGELITALRWLKDMEADGSRFSPDVPPADPDIDYVPVEVLPTFAGMGGGGTGDGERRTALIPRSMIVDVLRGQPSDFLLIDVRGDSMEPDFRHGDQILVDRRDCSPAQPGPFALWDGEWGEYVVKNVERSRAGEVRIFSSNPKYRAEAAESEQTRIIGRPVWFGRRL